MSSEKPQIVKAKVGFIKLFFTSCLGTLMALGVIVGGFVFVGYQASQSSSPSIKPNTVLKLTLNKPIPELSNNVPDNSYDFESMLNEDIGLTNTCELIDLAMEDDNIKGIYLDLSSVPVGWASSKVLRNKLLEFKEAGKFVMAYSTNYNQKSYYYASVADPIYLHPQGGFSFVGFSAQMMYFKGLMDKLGVTAQIFYAGKFKSATEPFRRKNMTPENRKQVSEYMSGMYDMYLEDLAVARNIGADELFRIADNALIREPKDAVTHKLVDATKYKDEVLDELREKLGTAEEDEIEVVSLKKYLSINKDKLNKLDATDKVAVIYAEGSIVDGQGDKGSIGGDKYASIIRKLRKDEDVKAIVMRVNSGGGSALASDIIWRELEKAKEQGIRVVTSMGDVAASGGYYIASNSERIFAEDRTITGSIGVFGMIPNMRGLYEDHLGLTMDTVKIGKYSMMSSFGTFFEFSEEEGKIIQDGVDQVYTTFKTRVSEGRGMSMEAVDSVAQGRVWLGTTALEIGLVDQLGGLNDAVKSVAGLANLSEDNYRVVSYPKTKSFEEKILAALGEDSEDGEAKTKLLQEFKSSLTASEYSEYNDLLKTVKELKSMKGIQMRLPYEIEIN
ncbi:signal peptide peptidase SppA [Aureispira anguillae]|uniref:Signal peptide peptidase SppA n=1 Tax=Aureispira anguillae TaxID=2864201 RepID=A0A915YC62_9BACT|nr:signal peptide peptidase SppA [Aureispira anguillae]BDS10382.1 signal peptide peptidase SppA [Aureispira anguillae]